MTFPGRVLAPLVPLAHLRYDVALVVPQQVPWGSGPDVVAEDDHPSNESMREDGKMWAWTSATRPRMATKPRVSHCHMTFNVQPRRRCLHMLHHTLFPGPGILLGNCFI